MFPDTFNTHIEIIGGLEFKKKIAENRSAVKWKKNVCTLCQHKLTKKEISNGPNCPKCTARERTRAMPIMLYYIQDLIKSWKEEEIIAFAFAGVEKRVLEPYISKYTSVALYGDYGAGSIEGVDVRDLSRFADSQFGGTFSSLLFDYFVEHDVALKELNRVIKKGGVLVTHCSMARFVDSTYVPINQRKVVTKKDHMEYIGSNEMYTVKFGKTWFYEAPDRNGFEPGLLAIRDTITNAYQIYYIGIKR
jgi:SAM-dependent methyltransferase